MFVSSIALTLEMNTTTKYQHNNQTTRDYPPLLADDSDAAVLPGSSALQYSVLVYGCTQKNLLCRLSLWPLPTTLRVYLWRYSPIMVCVMA